MALALAKALVGGRSSLFARGKKHPATTYEYALTDLFGFMHIPRSISEQHGFLLRPLAP